MGRNPYPLTRTGEHGYGPLGWCGSAVVRWSAIGGLCGLLVLATALCLLGSGSAAAGEVVETADDGSVRARYEIDEQGRKHGMLLRYHPNGQVALRAQYAAGERHGLERAWTEAGVLRWAHTYKHGALHGAHKTYDAKGRLSLQQRYRRGKLHGAYKSFHPNRRLHVVAAYRDGKLHGSFTERTAGGGVRLRATYQDGLKHGTYDVFSGKERISKQHWERGRPLDVDGIQPFPRSPKVLRDTLDTILKGDGALPSADLEADRELALRQLKAYRCLAGVPYADIELDARLNALAQAGSEICAALKRITHEPPNPGWPAERYAPAARGAKGSNLHQGHRACTSVRGYMDDSDPRNIRSVGHRCWCVNPAMKKTGFGHKDGFTAMWGTDESRTSVPDYEVVAVPPPGFVPGPWFGEHWAWSAALNPKHFDLPVAAKVRVRVEPVGEDFLPVGTAALPLEAVSVHKDSIAVPYLVIWRPRGISLAPSRRYRVTLEGLTRKGKPKPVRYYVEFFDHPYTSPRVPSGG